MIHFRQNRDREEIKAILRNSHFWNLRKLGLKNLILNDVELDEITKNHPNLEYFQCDMVGISEEGLSLLGKNCPSLKILKCDNYSWLTNAGPDQLTQLLSQLECFMTDLTGVSEEGIGILGRNCPSLNILDLSGIHKLTDSGLDQLTQRLPHLESIQLRHAYEITEEGVSAIARNCKKLRCISITNHKKIGESGIDALIDNCPDLRIISFRYGGPISLKGLYRFVGLKDKDGKLRRVELDNIQDVSKEQIDLFTEKLGPAREVLFCLDAKKLHALTLEK